MSAGLKSNADGTSLYLQLNGVDVVEVTDTTLSVAGSTVLDTNVGLNADFLDGFDSSQFLRSDTSDTFTGNQLTLNQSLKVGSDIKIDAGGTDDSVVDYVSSIDSIKFGAIKPVVFGGSLSAPRWEPTAGGTSYVMWNENNDGDGSGLDADKLDGFQGSQYLRSDVDDTFEANLTISGNLTVSGTTTTINTTNVTAEDAVITLNSGQTTPLNDIGLLFQRYATSDATNYNVGLAWDESADKFVIGKTPEDGADNDLTFNTEWLTLNDSTFEYQGSKVWHADNLLQAFIFSLSAIDTPPSVGDTVGFHAPYDFNVTEVHLSANNSGSNNGTDVRFRVNGTVVIQDGGFDPTLPGTQTFEIVNRTFSVSKGDYITMQISAHDEPNHQDFKVSLVGNLQ